VNILTKSRISPHQKIIPKGMVFWYNLIVMIIKRVLLFSGLLFLVAIGSSAKAVSVASKLRGRILLQVEANGEAWYVKPDTGLRIYMKDGVAAYDMMRNMGLGITDSDLAKIPQVGSATEMNQSTSICTTNVLANRLKGQILLQVQQHGEAWYVDVAKCRAIYMKDGVAAYELMRYLGLGISNADLEKIPLVQGELKLSGDETYQRFKIATSRGSFDISLVILDKSKYKMITDTAVTEDCDKDCATKPLASYVAINNAEIGINGTYFCPPDYPECSETKNSFLSPVFNTRLNKFINGDLSRFHNGPLMALGANGKHYYFHRSEHVAASLEEFRTYTGTTHESTYPCYQPGGEEITYNGKTSRLSKIGACPYTYYDKDGTYPAAAIANRPSLVEKNIIVVDSEDKYSSYNNKSVRGGIGYNDKNIFLVIARGADVYDLAEIFKTLGASEAMNLDGGGSAALYYNGNYVVGPGRSLPNAIVFKKL
jgi:hypothetical protein